MHNRTAILATALVLSVCFTSPSLAIDALQNSAPGPLVLNQDAMHESMLWRPAMVLDLNSEGKDDGETAIPMGAPDEKDYSVKGRMYQPPPIKQIVGKDNSSGFGLHHQGEACVNCHSLWPMTVIRTPQK